MPTATKQKAKTGSNEPLAALEKKLAEQDFTQRLELEPAEEGQACSIVWGTHRGVETPRVFLLALPAGSWEKANADYVYQLSFTQAPTDLAEDQYPKFGIVSDGEHEAIFDLEYPQHQIDRLPGLALGARLQPTAQQDQRDDDGGTFVIDMARALGQQA